MRVTRSLVVTTVMAAAVLFGCSSPPDASGPTPERVAAFNAAVAEGFGGQYMSSLPDRAAFEAAAYESGALACEYSDQGKSRDEFQTTFRTDSAVTANGSSIPNSVLDSVSLILWSTAHTHLCATGDTEKNATKVPIWAIALGAPVGIPVLLWLLAWTIGFFRVLLMSPKRYAEHKQFIVAWENLSMIPVERLGSRERRALRKMLNRWRMARRQGDPISADDFIRRDASRR